MKIIISNYSGVPIYEQIKSQIKSSILMGEMEDGEVLPSIRQLAKELKISVITTSRAYNELENEGFIISVQGKGCFVAPKNNELVKENALRRIEENLMGAISAAKTASISKSELLNIFEILIKDDDYE